MELLICRKMENFLIYLTTASIPKKTILMLNIPVGMCRQRQTFHFLSIQGLFLMWHRVSQVIFYRTWWWLYKPKPGRQITFNKVRSVGCDWGIGISAYKDNIFLSNWLRIVPHDFLRISYISILWFEMAYSLLRYTIHRYTLVQHRYWSWRISWNFLRGNWLRPLNEAFLQERITTKYSIETNEERGAF
jgi:hypothetical protein